jgi:RimJ/RimL family protein N-acetyltransferase
MIIELLEDLDPLLSHIARLWAEPEDTRSRPFSSDVPFDAAARAERYRTGWAKPLTEPGWSRTWGLLDGNIVFGHLDLKGGQLASDLHRATLGIGLERDATGKGHGSAMMLAAIAWARDNRLAWIDLGVFSGNARARHLYRKLGFVEVGTVRDRFRVDGASIDDVSMTLAL